MTEETPDRSRGNLAAAFAATGRDGIARHYEGWADAYEAETTALGYRMPGLCAALFARYVPADAGPALDAGCGTGLAGDYLHILGYSDLTGIDLSDAMLARARARGTYTRLERMVLGETLDLATGAFAGTIASGVFTDGHAPHSAFDELIRVTRPGGHIVFNVRETLYETGGFGDAMAALETAGRWRLAERSAPFRPFILGEAQVIARLFAYEAV